MKRGEAALGKIIVAAFAIGMVVLVSQSLNAGFLDLSAEVREPYEFGVASNEKWDNFSNPDFSNVNIEYIENNRTITMQNDSQGSEARFRSKEFTNSTGTPNTVSKIETEATGEDNAYAHLKIETSRDFDVYGAEENHVFKIPASDNEIEVNNIQGEELRFDVYFNNSQDNQSYEVNEALIYGSKREEGNGVLHFLLNRGITIFLVIVALLTLLIPAGR